MDLISKAVTWGVWYWPIWLGVSIAAFLGPETEALVTGDSNNTLSAWVWRSLKIHHGETIAQWSATDFLVFGIWATLVVWLTFHFFLGRFA